MPTGFSFPVLQAKPSRALSDAWFTPIGADAGVNMGPNGWADPVFVQLALDLGVDYIRGGDWQWSEMRKADGTYHLTAGMDAYLTQVCTSARRPILLPVAAYNPNTIVQPKVTVATSAAVGSFDIALTDASGIVPTFDFLDAADGSDISAKGAGYGTVILGTVGNTLHLGSKLTVALPAGTKLNVTRLAFAPPQGPDPTQPITDEFANRYIRAIFDLAEPYNPRGVLAGVLNEPTRAGNPIDDLDAFCDSDCPYSSGIPNLQAAAPYVLAALNLTGLRDHNRVYNGASDVKASGSMVINTQVAPFVTLAKIAGAMPVESRHPYDDSPEGSLWIPGQFPLKHSNKWNSLQPITDPGDAAHHAMAIANYRAANGGRGPQHWATECGTTADDTRRGVYAERRMWASWGAGIRPIFYCLTTNGPYAMVNADYSPRPDYYAVQRGLAVSDRCGPGRAAIASMPQPTYFPNIGSTQLAAVGIYGGAQAALGVWQVPQENGTTFDFNTMSRAPARGVELAIPADRTITKVTILSTGQDLVGQTSRHGDSFTVPVADDVVCVEVARPSFV